MTLQKGSITGITTGSTPSGYEGSNVRILTGFQGSGLSKRIADKFLSKGMFSDGTQNVISIEESEKEKSFALIEAIAEAIVDEIQANAIVSFTAGQITGVCPVGGGPLVSGIGIGGRIT